MSAATESPFDDHKYRPRESSDSRSPCPALNTLANHGYLPHNGRELTFMQLMKAMVLVYNISYPLAFFLASAAFLTCGKLSFHSHYGVPSGSHTRPTSFMNHFINRVGSLATWIFRRATWTLDLQSLSRRGPLKIAHDGALVHPDGRPSTVPDCNRVEDLLQQASTARNSEGLLKGGLNFFDIVRIRTENVLSPTHPMLNVFHQQVSLGECGLLWEVFRNRAGGPEAVIPTYRLRQLLGKEQLPDGWWDSRPKTTVGLFRARRTANEADRLSTKIAEEGCIRKLAKCDVIAIDR